MAKATLNKYFVNCSIFICLSACLWICIFSLVFVYIIYPKYFVLEVHVDSLCEY